METSNYPLTPEEYKVLLAWREDQTAEAEAEREHERMIVDGEIECPTCGHCAPWDQATYGRN
jgi:hypothetical protein